MLYVQQSLGPGEEILIGARFHWMYTFQAVMWVVFGLAMGIAVGYAAIWWAVADQIRAMYPGLPSHLFSQAWGDIVGLNGGYLKLLWSLNPVIRFSILALFLIGLYLFAHMMIIKATTEIAVTTERMIYKRGLIARHVGELDIDRIEGVSVYQGVFGRILGYGSVMIRGMGVGEVLLPPIEAPIEFRKAIQEARQIAEKSGAKQSTDL
jgi:hypothetical protein